MKLGLVIDHLGSGGAQRQLVEIAGHLHSSHGVSVSVAVYHDADFFRSRLESAGVSITRLRKSRRFDFSFPAELRRWVRATAPDVVHAFMLAPSAWSLLALRGLPAPRRPAFVAAERSAQIANTATHFLLQRIVYRRADAVTANAGPVAAAIRRRLGVPSPRVHYIPNGIDLASWDRAAEEPWDGPIEPDRFHIALIGRIDPVKNHSLLLDALAMLPPERRRVCRVWFVGARTSGDAFAREVAAKIRRAGLEDVVRELPATPAIAAFLRRMDALVLTSKLEGFPNAVLEGMASRLPCVGARVGDVPHMIEHAVSGLLFDAGDARGLALRLEELLGMSARERRMLGERARAEVEARFRIETVAAQYAELHASLARAATPEDEA